MKRDKKYDAKRRLKFVPCKYPTCSNILNSCIRQHDPSLVAPMCISLLKSWLIRAYRSLGAEPIEARGKTICWKLSGYKAFASFLQIWASGFAPNDLCDGHSALEEISHLPIFFSQQLLLLWGQIMPRPHVLIKELDLRNGHTFNTVNDRLNAVPGFKTSAG
jgi:hypothetical protein